MSTSHPNHRGPVVMITGASAGVGRATAIAFARHGATIGRIARGRAGLAAAKHDVEAAGLGDRYLARNGYTAQQTSQPEDPNRPNNLWSPVDDTHDFGAHGRFDDLAHVRSWEQLVARHRTVTFGVLLALAAVATWASLGGRQVPTAA